MENLENKIYQCIREDFYYSLRDLIENYCIVNVEKYLYFSASLGSFRTFKYLYKISLKNKIILDNYKVIDNAKNNKDSKIFCFLIKNYKNDFGGKEFLDSSMFFHLNKSENNNFYEILKYLIKINKLEEYMNIKDEEINKRINKALKKIKIENNINLF